MALARAIVIEPRVLLCDEPLGALDKKLRQQMQFELKQLQKRLGVTLVFVTHDQEEALAMSDRIAVMNGGKVEQVGTPIEIYDQPTTRFIADFIGDTNLFRGERVATRHRHCARERRRPHFDIAAQRTTQAPTGVSPRWRCGPRNPARSPRQRRAERPALRARRDRRAPTFSAARCSIASNSPADVASPGAAAQQRRRPIVQSRGRGRARTGTPSDLVILQD